MILKKIIPFSTLFILVGVFSQSFAAGFQVSEQSAALTGTANAGSAVTDDATSEFFNPAGMAFITHPEISASLVGIFPKISFQPSVATNALGTSILPTSDTNSPQKDAFIPGFYIVYPVNHQLTFGFGASAPFGLATEYDDQSVARYFATKSAITTLDFSPALSIKPSPDSNLAFGLGLDVLYAKAELDQNLDAQGIFNLIFPAFSGDVPIRNVADNWGVGWHAGVMWKATPTTDVGFAYHSRISVDLKGNRTIGLENALLPLSQFALAGLGLVDSPVEAPLTFPDYETVSIKQYLTSQWDILADISHVQWSEIKNITLNFGPGLPNNVTPLNYRDTWRFAVGQEYQIFPWWKFRTGVAYDQTPVRQEFIDARLPDADRVWITVGSNFKINKKWDMDVSYAHIFFKNSNVNLENQVNNTLIANYNADADLVGMQINYRFNA